jgi:hypothetical protein
MGVPFSIPRVPVIVRAVVEESRTATVRICVCVAAETLSTGMPRLTIVLLLAAKLLMTVVWLNTRVTSGAAKR